MKSLTVAALCLAPLPLFAQYRTESYDLRAGWNAIYLNLDTESRTLQELLAPYPNVEEVWLWNPKGLEPTIIGETAEPHSGQEWLVWRRAAPTTSTLSSLRKNGAYLIKLKDSSPNQSIAIKGKAVQPIVRWRTDGMNLVGFPVASNTSANLSNLLQAGGLVDSSTQVYRYVPGPLGENNPASTSPRITQAKRGEAFWIRSGTYADYYGPLRVTVALSSDGLSFGTSSTPKRVTLTNRSDSPITVNLENIASEPAPGQTSAPSAPTLTQRVENQSTGFFDYPPLTGPLTIQIPAKQTVGITLGIDRSSLSGPSASTFASLLKITDSNSLEEIYLPVTAQKTSFAGLWVGEAQISKVQNQLQNFQRNSNGNYIVGEDGQYILNGNNTSLSNTNQTFPLRLLIHVDESGNATLLSEVYQGIIAEQSDGTPVLGLSTKQSSILTEHLQDGAKVSASHLPRGLANALSGTLATGSTLTGSVTLGANAPTNPFIHTYHPDHDNLDARFENTLPPGIESHQVTRAITLSFDATPPLGLGPSWGTSTLTGTYSETVSGIHKKPIATQGIFALRKISDIPTLIQP